jgi:predicted trehalose synthase
MRKTFTLIAFVAFGTLVSQAQNKADVSVTRQVESKEALKQAAPVTVDKTEQKVAEQKVAESRIRSAQQSKSSMMTRQQFEARPVEKKTVGKTNQTAQPQK